MVRNAIERIVIIGAGHAGVELAAALRSHNFTGTIDLLSDEADHPYQRPPLSKEYIKRPGEALVLKPQQFFDAQNIKLHLGCKVVSIDPAAHQVKLSDGSELAYDHLVLATGARNRKLPIPGLDHPSTIELRTLEDANRIVEQIASWQRIAIIGGGFIGLEAAGLLATMGISVDVVEMAPRLMQRAVTPAISDWFLKSHLRQNSRVHLSRVVKEIEHRADHIALRLDDGGMLEVDAVLLAAGVVPNVELAEQAGLSLGNGIIVDEYLTSSDPDISAIGDCASFPNSYLAQMTRLESVQNAVDQAKALAATLTGDPVKYDALPWFWSIQGEARLQIAGLSSPDQHRVLRGDPEGGSFSVFLYENDRLVAVESVNAAGDHMAARRLIGAGINVPKDAAQDLTIPLKSFL